MMSWRSIFPRVEQVSFDRALAILGGWCGQRVLAHVDTLDGDQIGVLVATGDGALRPTEGIDAEADEIFAGDEVRFAVGDAANMTFALYRSRFVDAELKPDLDELDIYLGCVDGDGHMTAAVLIAITGPRQLSQSNGRLRLVPRDSGP
jgi:hypothetical protein